MKKAEQRVFKTIILVPFTSKSNKLSVALLIKVEIQGRKKKSEAQGSVCLFLEARKGELVHVSRRALV